ncbi:MAG: hypothetical protein ABFC94_15655 [Syntrophomonas sp.]
MDIKCPYCGNKKAIIWVWLYRVSRAFSSKSRNMQIVFCSSCDSFFELRTREIYTTEKLWKDRN